MLLCVMTLLLLMVIGCGGGGGENSLMIGNVYYKISGNVNLNGVALAGVTIMLSGSGSGSAATDSSGAYSFSGLPNGSYTLTPSKTGYTFSPSSISVSVSGANIAAKNFTAENALSNVDLNFTLETNYTPYSASKITVWHNFDDSWVESAMTQETADSWTFTRAIRAGKSYVFRLQSNFDTGSSLQWYTTSWIESKAGIRAKSLKINGIQIDKSYIVFGNTNDYVQFSITVASDGAITPGPGTSPNIDERIPPEVTWPEPYNKYPVPPSEYKAMLMWMQALHDDRKSGNSIVEVDYIKLYCRVGEVDQLVSEDNFSSSYGGALYIRRPFFLTDEHLSMNATISSSGYMIFYPSDNASRVWHWWSTRGSVPSGAQQCWGEARVRITGPAVVQAGGDYYTTINAPPSPGSVPRNPLEAGVGKWYFESAEWQLVTFNKP